MVRHEMISEVDIFNPFIGANHNRCDHSRSFSQYYKGVFSLCLVFVVRERVPFSFLCASCVKVNTFPASRADLRYIRVAGRQEIQHMWLFSAAWRSHRLVHSSSDAKLLFPLLVDLWIFVLLCVFFAALLSFL